MPAVIPAEVTMFPSLMKIGSGPRSLRPGHAGGRGSARIMTERCRSRQIRSSYKYRDRSTQYRPGDRETAKETA